MGGAFKQQQSMVFTVFAAHSLIIAFVSVISDATAAERSLPHFSPSDVEKIVAGSCLVAANSEAGLGSMEALTALGLGRVFSGENGVVFGLVDTQNFIWTSGNQLSWTEHSQSSSKAGIVLFRKQLFDRSCLFRPLSPKPKAEAYGGPLDQYHLVPFINKRCHTFRSVTGSLNIAGKHRQKILSNLFRVRDVSNINMKMALSSKNSLIFRESENYLTSKRAPSCVKPNHFSLADFTCGAPGHGAEHLYSSTPFKEMEARQSQTPRKTETGKAQNEPVTMTECEKISAPTQEEFFHKYLKLSKPVIIKGIVDKWPAMSKWTNRFLRDHLRGQDVHIKLTPNQEYEGVEKANIWEDHKTFKIPYEVRSKLLYPDLVVVRPATLNLPFEDFLDVVESVANGTRANISAYLEYTSIPNYMPYLEVDLVEPDLMAGLLKRKHLNMWLSDGNTVGKLHFDQFDNLLCQLSGAKEVILFDPQNNKQLYEAHIPEALLGYDNHTGQFRRKKLLDSTSMVMSPVEMTNPDFKRFPEFAKTYPLNCTIGEGEMLFMPAFWWHEVKSTPSLTEARNLAVNYWYEPFLTKEFPCPECQLDINPSYYHLLEK